MTGPVCPKCGRSAFPQETRYGIRHRCCGLWSWDGKPLVDAETHAARKAVHAAFDAVWKSGRVKRKEAYRQLAQLLGLKRGQCHMSTMDAVTACRVLQVVGRIAPDIDDFQVIE